MLKPGGSTAFAIWSVEQLSRRRMFSLNAGYVPPSPDVPSPVQRGDVAILRQRLGMV